MKKIFKNKYKGKYTIIKEANKSKLKKSKITKNIYSKIIKLIILFLSFIFIISHHLYNNDNNNDSNNNNNDNINYSNNNYNNNYIINQGHVELNYYYKERLRTIKLWRRVYNESNLVTLEDKINWIAIHDVSELKGKCADKILVHEYSKKILNKDICNKILKVYDDPNEINISELPEKFVLKTNHGSGFNIIVTNKAEFDLESAKRKLNHWLSIDYGRMNSEFHYSLIKRKVFAEEYIGKEVINYKFFCYHSIPRFILIYQKINGTFYRTYYDIKWNLLDWICVGPPLPNANYIKPKTFETMKNYASELSKPFKFVRVDLYEYDNEVRLGEMTFLPFNSFIWCNKPEYDNELSKYLKLF